MAILVNSKERIQALLVCFAPVVVRFFNRLPKYACKFIEMCLMITADHGPGKYI